MELYPLKFEPILKEKIWGGQKLKNLFGKRQGSMPNIGESWEISGYGTDISVVANGYLAGNQIDELIEVYMGELVGDKVYERCGLDFPLLFKLIDAGADLSIQVHPDDEVAARDDSPGKTEMWVVLGAEPGGKVIAGLREDTNREDMEQALDEGRLTDMLQIIEVKAGDVIFVPAGRIHAICKGVVLAEIQQSCDLTYRLFDYDRTDGSGNKRELHIDRALEAIDYQATPQPLIKYEPKTNGAVNLVQCPYFTTNLISFDRTIQRDYALLDSFVTYMCIEGCVEIETIGGKEAVRCGETILIPNSLEQVTLRPLQAPAKLIEVYID